MKYSLPVFAQLVLLLNTHFAVAQKPALPSATIYATAEDFSSRHESGSRSIRNHRELKEVLKSPGIFAIKTGDNKLFRVADHKMYRIIDSAGFLLYARSETEWGGKGSSMIRTERYYFSRSVFSPVLPLTISNLENAFAANVRFRYALESTFHEDRELPVYDNYVKKYKVKKLYCMTM